MLEYPPPPVFSRKNLKQKRECGQTGISFVGRFVHPIPEFWKYYFYFFTEAATEEGDDFFCKENRLCIYEYEKRLAEFDADEDLAIVTNERLPRKGPDTPFDEDHPRWEDFEWAPPLNEDSDPPVEGGHR